MIALLLSILQGPSWVTSLREKFDLPAIGAIEIEGGNTVSIVCEGIIEKGSEAKATGSSKWHLGSNSKAFTALLTATFIKTGALGYDSKVVSLLDLEKSSHEGWANLTVRQLIEHTSGLSSTTYPAGRQWFLDKAPIREQRADYAKRVLLKAPGEAGKFLYSNQNYTLLGAICEKLGNAPWEDLVRERIFKPLELTSAGFGLVSDADPQPHKFKDSKFEPVADDEVKDNAAVVGPAGTIHMNLADYGKWIRAVIDQKEILSAPGWSALLTPSTPTGRYGGGWIAVRSASPASPVVYFSHFGSNTMNTFGTWIDPIRRRAVAIATNAHNSNLMEAMNKTMTDWMKR